MFAKALVNRRIANRLVKQYWHIASSSPSELLAMCKNIIKDLVAKKEKQEANECSIIMSMQGQVTLFQFLKFSSVFTLLVSPSELLAMCKNKMKDLVAKKERQEANECSKSVTSLYNGKPCMGTNIRA